MSTPTPRRLNVFVSSVYQELKEYRMAAIDVIWRCDLYPTGMDRLDIALPVFAHQILARNGGGGRHLHWPLFPALRRDHGAGISMGGRTAQTYPGIYRRSLTQ